MASFALVTLCLAHIALLPRIAAGAEAGKSGRPLVAAGWAHTRDVRRSLSDIMDDNLSHEHRRAKEVRVDRLTEALRPLYTALPKNGRGRLEHATVRYALHRHFVHKHGMYVKGFEPAGEAWNSSSPADILEDKVPGYVQHLFEERLHDGFDLNELALLAATLEHFIHLENVERLEKAYELSGVSANESVTAEALESVLDRYSFLQLQASPQLNSAAFEQQFRHAAQIFPEWPETQKFLREVEESTLESVQVVDNSLVSFDTATSIIEAASMRYGRFQDGGCRSLAKDLIAKEDKGSGRILLSDFYQAGWNFRENKDYLRSLGALEEIGNIPRVIIPNYVLSKTNCIASSSMYTVCCIDQCEELLGHLERRIAAPESTPERIIDLIASLPSATVQAPRHLSVSLVKHLNQIADGHAGTVPLHGRLFAQWMHHAYPRECPFPVAAGTIKPMTADDWIRETNQSIVYSNAEIRALQEEQSKLTDKVKVKDLVDGDLEATLPWSDEEELVFHHAKPSMSHELGVLAKGIACLGALSAVIFQLLQMMIGASQEVRVQEKA